MDRIEFLHTIDLKGNDFPTTVFGFFDSFMALYSLVGYDNVTVASVPGNNCITFTVSFDESDKINQLQNLITQNNNTIFLYGRQLTVVSNIIDNKSINITIY